MRATRGMRERFDWGGRGRRIYYSCGVRSLEAARRRCHRRMTVPMLAGSIATGRPATAPSHATPTSDSSHTAIQPQTTTDRDRDEDDHQHLGAIRRGWSGGGAGSPTACSRSRPLSRDRTRCPRCPASRGTTRRSHRQAVVARVPRRARPVVRIRPQVRPGALHPRARCRPARQDAADS